jgi:hypothetical protein
MIALAKNQIHINLSRYILLTTSRVSNSLHLGWTAGEAAASYRKQHFLWAMFPIV